MTCCRFCNGTETKTNPSGHVVEVRDLDLCSKCVQVFLNLSSEQIRDLHSLAVEKGHRGKAEILKNLMEGEDGRQESPRRANRQTGGYFHRKRGLDKKAARLSAFGERFAVPAVDPDM